MGTLRDVVSQIRTSFKLMSSDNLISDRAIASELKSVSFQLIKQQTDKRKLMGSDTLFTQIDCLQMEPASLAECCSYTSPCQIARSVLDIPDIAENIYGPLIQGVYSIDKKNVFDYIDPNRYANYLSLYPKKQQKEKYFWIRNNKLYISDPNIETVVLSAFFEEDINTTIYGCGCDKQPCPQNPLDAEFKCPGYLLNSVISITRSNLVETYKRSQEDPQEDNKDQAR